MKVSVYHSPSSWERDLAHAFTAGARIYGDAAAMMPLAKYAAPDADVGVVIGTREIASKIIDGYRKANRKIVVLDRGFIRPEAYWRATVGEATPIRYITEMTSDGRRAEKLGITLLPMREDGGHVVFAGSGRVLGHSPIDEIMLYQLQRLTSRGITYRPNDPDAALPIDGVFVSRKPRTLADELKGAWLLVTESGDAAVDALIAGIPVIVTGRNAARPLASTSLTDVENPLIPTEEARRQWFWNLTNCQWTLSEFRSGEAWETLGEQVRRF